MGRRRKCRLWWPNNCFSQTPPYSSFLFGWFIPDSEASVDIVVAFLCDEPKFTSSLDAGLDLQHILQGANKNMPALLQDKSKIALLGYLAADFSGKGELVGCGNNDRNTYMKSNNDRSRSCGCHRHNGILERHRLAAMENMWIKLVYSLSDTKDGSDLLIPKLDHLHLNDETISLLDLHVCNLL